MKTKHKNYDVSKNIFLIRLYFQAIHSILEAFADSNILKASERLNSAYTELVKKVEKILSKEEHKELYNLFPDIPSNLKTNIEDFDIDWEYGISQRTNEFIDKIETVFTQQSKKQYKISKQLQTFLESVDSAIKQHSKEQEKFTEILTTSLEEHQKGSILRCKDLTVNLSQGTISYENNEPVQINIAKNHIQLLIILMKHNRIVEYTEIAKKLNLNCYHKNCTNTDVAREIQYLKRDLREFLTESIGIFPQDFDSMFRTVRKVGLQLSR